MTSNAVKLDINVLQSILSQHLPMYKTKVPHYQAMMLDSLLEIWSGRPAKLLDIGGGTGVIAEAMDQLFPVGEVQAIDLVDRFCKNLSIKTECYDGRTLIFADGAFDAATLNNVLHHVPVPERLALLREIRRVVNGPLYIKDHVTGGAVDDIRLTTLDAIGNIPFGGMIKAKYLASQEWQSLADASGWRIGAIAKVRPYRRNPMAMIFPNRLEITMRFDPA